MDVRLEINDGQVLGALQRLIALGLDPTPALEEIGGDSVAATQLRFKTGVGPDGQRWQPSLRAQLTGGKTLRKDGHLENSLSWNVGRAYVEWGVADFVYTRIHQFGGTITPKSGGSLKFRLPNGGFAVVKAVRMPARPYLGVNDDDRADILDVFERRIRGAFHAG